jgi:hypothetical protein
MNPRRESARDRRSVKDFPKICITNWTQQVDTTSTNVQVMTYDPVNQLLSDTVHSN